MSDDDTDWENFDSGPFCRHWSSPCDCEILCARCGHRCPRHDENGCDGDHYSGIECDCKEWVEPDDRVDGGADEGLAEGVEA